MSEPMKYMSIEEFKEKGFLQEINRLLLHRCGIALSVIVDDVSGKAINFGPIWDCRDDPEGIVFGEYSEDKVDMVQNEINRHDILRFNKYEFYIQDRNLDNRKLNPDIKSPEYEFLTEGYDPKAKE